MWPHRFPLTTPLGFDQYLAVQDAFERRVWRGEYEEAFDEVSRRIARLLPPGSSASARRRATLLFESLLAEPDALWLCRRAASRLRLPAAHLARLLRSLGRRLAARLVVRDTQRFCEHSYAGRQRPAAIALGRLVQLLLSMRTFWWTDSTCPSLNSIPHRGDLLLLLHRLLLPLEAARFRQPLDRMDLRRGTRTARPGREL